jgi:hypothetical protein
MSNDWSDGMQYEPSESYATESANPRRHDHRCLLNEWSCGDGQCLIVDSMVVKQHMKDIRSSRIS